MLDPKTLRSRVFEATGLKLSQDDPLFAAIFLNDAVLAEYLQHHPRLLSEHEKRVAALAARLETRAAQLGEPSRLDGWRLAMVVVMLVLAGVLRGAAGGWLVRQYMVASPAALTPDEARYLANGKRLAQILPKLDPQTRLKLDAAWQRVR
jgi:hypothetical protein